MPKNFRLVVPKKIAKDIELIDAENVDPNLVSIGGKKIKISELKIRSFAPEYNMFPARWILEDLVSRYGGNLSLDPPDWGSTPIEHWQYVDHRQMNEGRAIARGTHSRRRFIDRVDNTWEFLELIPLRVPNPNYNPNWQTIPRDYKNKSKEKISYDMKTYYVEWDGVLPFPDSSASSSSFFGRDSYMWAVYFLVNGYPSSSQWFPVPARNPSWNSLGIGEFVPDYIVPTWWDFG